MPTLTVRPATAADIAAFSPLPQTPTMRAVVGEIDGRRVGLGGLALWRGRWFAFCDLTEEARAHKVAIARAAHRLFAAARRDGIRFVYAAADSTEPGAVRWLTHLGFHVDPRNRRYFRWSA